MKRFLWLVASHTTNKLPCEFKHLVYSCSNVQGAFSQNGVQPIYPFYNSPFPHHTLKYWFTLQNITTADMKVLLSNIIFSAQTV